MWDVLHRFCDRAVVERTCPGSDLISFAAVFVDGMCRLCHGLGSENDLKDDINPSVVLGADAMLRVKSGSRVRVIK